MMMSAPKFSWTKRALPSETMKLYYIKTHDGILMIVYYQVTCLHHIMMKRKTCYHWPWTVQLICFLIRYIFAVFSTLNKWMYSLFILGAVKGFTWSYGAERWCVLNVTLMCIVLFVQWSRDLFFFQFLFIDWQINLVVDIW